MKLELTRRGDYAIRAMLALGRAGGARLSTPVMAASMNIPVRFLPQVMGDLARAGLVRSRAGRNGGPGSPRKWGQSARNPPRFPWGICVATTNSSSHSSGGRI